MSSNRDNTTRKTGEDIRRDNDETVDTGLPIDEPQVPAPKESQHLPNTGASTPTPPQRNPQDTMDEARDGFMDRYPPRGQDE